MNLDEKNLEKVKITLECGDFLFRKPNKNEVILYQDELIKSESSVSLIMEKFLRQLFCGENSEDFVALLNAKPLIIPRILATLLKDLGGEENFTESWI